MEQLGDTCLVLKVFKAKNKHLEHLEDQIIDNGSKGGQNAVNFLVAIRNMLSVNQVEKSI